MSRPVWFWLLIPILLLGCRQAQEEAPALATEATAAPTSIIPISAPESLPAGEPLQLTIGPFQAHAAETIVHLTMIGSYGPQLFTVSLYNGMGELNIPAENTLRSGVYTLVASYGAARGQATIEITPHEAVGPLTPLVGARSIIADGKHWAMVMIIPFDKFGNPIRTGAPVIIRAMHPLDMLELRQSKTEHLVAFTRIYSNITAGRTEISTQVDDVFGHEKLLLEVPGWPEPFDLYFDVEEAPADGFQYVTIRTDIIKDEFGNVMPDGTQINFIVTGVDGSWRTLPALTIDGAAEVIMQTPVIPGTIEVRGSVYGVTSPPFSLEFTPGPAVDSIPVKLEIDQKERELIIVAGPALGQLNQFVADGTLFEYTFTLEGGDSFTQYAQAENGVAATTLRLSTLLPGTYEVEVRSGAATGKLTFVTPESVAE